MGPKSQFSRKRQPTPRPNGTESWALADTDTLRMRVKCVMRSTNYGDPMREWAGFMPRRMDGSGVVRIRMRAGNAQYFRMAELPEPRDLGELNADTAQRFFPMPKEQKGPNNKNYRIAVPGRYRTGKPQMCRFRLSSPNYLIQNS